MENLKIGILGFGEVGKGVGALYKEFFVEDRKVGGELGRVDILHICIPYTATFLIDVKRAIKKCGPKLTVIHSTVPVGTTAKIGGAVVHSPVRGVHPNLAEGIKTFVKYVGYDNDAVGRRAVKHFKEIGLSVRGVKNSRNTEALKLWDTTQYGMFIVLNKAIKRYCVARKLDFDVVYKEANESYNDGYIQLGRPEVVRPSLKYMAGRIGGHCVIPNCLLLDTEISNFILKKNDDTGNL